MADLVLIKIPGSSSYIPREEGQLPPLTLHYTTLWTWEETRKFVKMKSGLMGIQRFKMRIQHTALFGKINFGFYPPFESASSFSPVQHSKFRFLCILLFQSCLLSSLSNTCISPRHSIALLLKFPRLFAKQTYFCHPRGTWLELLHTFCLFCEVFSPRPYAQQRCFLESRPQVFNCSQRFSTLTRQAGASLLKYATH